MSQTALASRAGVAQSVISAYESDRREPGRAQRAGFGSVARGDDSDASDIDLLVDLDPTVGLVALAGLARELHDLLGVNVDVVPAGSLKPNVRRTALAEAIAL